MIHTVTIHYPNGERYLPTGQITNHSTTVLNPTNHGKRGITLEDDINESNLYYLNHNIAVIHKKPTPIQIVKVDYPRRSAAMIKEAYFRQASTTDYNGIYKGRYVDFDAKETHNKTSFPLNNFHKHQIEHMRNCLNQGGICFGLIKFVTINRLYLLPASDLITYWDKKNIGRKSIPINYFETTALSIHYALNPVIPYLEVVDNLLS